MNNHRKNKVTTKQKDTCLKHEIFHNEIHKDNSLLILNIRLLKKNLEKKLITHAVHIVVLISVL